MLSKIFAESTLEISRELSDARFVILNDKYRYFIQDDEAAKALYKDCYKAAMSMSDFPRSKALAGENAYKVMVFFGAGNIIDSLAGFDHVVAQDEELSRFCKEEIQLPICIDYGRTSLNLDFWKAMLPNVGLDVLKFGNHLSRIEEIGGFPKSPEEFQELLPRALFARYDENPNLAKLVMIYEDRLKELFFNAVVDRRYNVHDRVDVEAMPDMVVNVKLHNDSGAAYVVKLPEEDIRCKLFSMHSNSIFYITSTRHGFYVAISPKDGVEFDPTKIDWQNLEKQGHKILKVYHVLMCPEGELRVDDTYSLRLMDDSAFHGSIWDILGPKFIELIPEVERISDAHFRSSEQRDYNGKKMGVKETFVYTHELYVAEQLSELRGQICNYYPSTGGHSVINIAQSEKLLELGREYLDGIYNKEYLTQFVVGDCENAEQIRARHTELKALQVSNQARHDLLFSVANKISYSSAVRYGDLINLSDAILGFLNSDGAKGSYKCLININTLLQDAHEVIDIKRNLLKIYAKSLLGQEEFIEKIAGLSEDKVDVLISEFALTVVHWCSLRLSDIYELDLAILKAALSGNAMILYMADQVSFASLVKDHKTALEMKRHILAENILMIAKDSNAQMLEFGPIEQLYEVQLDFLMSRESRVLLSKYLDGFLKLIVDIDKHGDDTHYMEARRLEISIEKKFNNDVPEGCLVQLDQDRFDLISDSSFHGYFLSTGSATLQQIVSLEVAKLEQLCHHHRFNDYFKNGGTFEALVMQDADQMISFASSFHPQDDARSIAGDSSNSEGE